MFFQMIYQNSALSRMHSNDLTDMREALSGTEPRERPEEPETKEKPKRQH